MEGSLIGTRRIVRDILIDDDVKTCLATGTVRALRQALVTDNPLRPLNDLGVQRYSNVVEQVSALIIPLGFTRNDEICQVRLESVDTRFGCPVRILMCKGMRDAEQTMKVNPKGLLARQLVSENAPYVPQLGLWPQEESPASEERIPFQNYWLFWEVTGLYKDEVVISLALPIGLNSCGTRFSCVDLEELYRGNLDEFVEPNIDIPESATVMPTIEEVD